MNSIKIAFSVTHEAYQLIQAAAARVERAVPVYVREVIFRDAQVSAASLEAQPHISPRLTQTQRDVLQLLKNNAETVNSRPLTTFQVQSALSQSDHGIYMSLRALIRDGLVERCDNVQRSGYSGAPFKTYAITEQGAVALADARSRMQKDHDVIQARQQLDYEKFNGRPRVPSGPTPEQTERLRQAILGFMKYLAMHHKQRHNSEAEYAEMEALAATMRAEAEEHVAKGARTWVDMYGHLRAKLDALGGEETIAAHYNGALTEAEIAALPNTGNDQT